MTGCVVATSSMTRTITRPRFFYRGKKKDANGRGCAYMAVMMGRGWWYCKLRGEKNDMENDERKKDNNRKLRKKSLGFQVFIFFSIFCRERECVCALRRYKRVCVCVLEPVWWGFPLFLFSEHQKRGKDLPCVEKICPSIRMRTKKQVQSKEDQLRLNHSRGDHHHHGCCCCHPAPLIVLFLFLG
ncbi:hypothetical protein BDB00DRAFT_12715 [Zychaea mexicana]|uniref:uncharacterized protein n=1 Tax=Zychaea mexicana TaxID=64656 RepID=UPI0022FDEF94|nr:uncharacterized protein BDB00DRAFT_12715 [Zychaea mexicana]KAI9499692.1 hypothetical protein BDB00DRAFT_12715 [Zychaea mexicana]